MKNDIMGRFSILFNLKSIAGILLSLLCIWWAFRDFKFYSFIKIIIEIKYGYLILAALFLWISVWLRGIRWKFLFSSSPSPNVFSLYKIQMMGYFGNNVLPLRAGEIMRAFMINKEWGLSKTYAFGTIILERVFDIITLISLAFILVSIYPSKNVLQSNIVWVSFVIVLAIMVSFKILDYLKDMKTEFFFIKHIKGVIDGIRSIESKSIFPVIILSVMIWGIYLLDIYFLQCAFELNLNFSQILMMLVFSSIIMGVPAAPGMVGTYHASVQYTLVDLFGFSSIQGNAFALVMHAYGYILLTFIGLYYFMKNQFKLSMISKIIEQK